MYARQSARASRDRGFTITELLVVVSIIGVLLGLVLPGLSAARRASQNTACRSNMRQLFLGMQTFADQNKEKFISPNTSFLHTVDLDGPSGWDDMPDWYVNMPPKQVKVKAWVNADPATNLEPDPYDELSAIEKPQALWEGWAYEYCGDGVYASPQDKSGRLRSYSINGFISEAPDPFYWNLLHEFNLKQPPATTVGVVPHPDRTMFLIPEDMRGQAYGWAHGGWNLHGWLIDLVTPVWIDLPAFFQKDGVNLCYLDGRVEFHQFEENGLYRQLKENNMVYEGEDHDFFKGIVMPGLERRMGLPEFE